MALYVSQVFIFDCHLCFAIYYLLCQSEFMCVCVCVFLSRIFSVVRFLGLMLNVCLLLWFSFVTCCIVPSLCLLSYCGTLALFSFFSVIPVSYFVD